MYRKVIYKITYPNGKIYIGQDVTDDINYYGSPDRDSLKADFTDIDRMKFSISKEILWETIEENKGYSKEVNRKEIEFILKFNSNNPEVGYNKKPKFSLK